MTSDRTLALHGGVPVRPTLLPYGRQSVDEEDIRNVTETLRSDWLTTGPKVQEFESAFASFAGSKHAVAVNSGTAALHVAYDALGIGPGDEVIVPAMTFAATANAAAFLGASPVFVDVEPDTLLIDPVAVERAMTKKTKAIVAVDYAGHPCDYDALNTIAENRRVRLLSDACHALGGTYKTKKVGMLADFSTFSFHPVKPMTTGEGGMITTDDDDGAARMRRFRNHCLSTDHRERQEKGSWFYEMTGLGYNYRLTDIQCALGLSQLRHVPEWTKRRQKIAKLYDEAFAENGCVRPLTKRQEVSHAYHLYVVRFDLDRLGISHDELFRALRAENIGVNVHYIPVHLHPFYQERFGTKPGLCPVAEAAYERILTLPLFSAMSDADARDVITAIEKICTYFSRE